eukprot:10806646-Ditylum_brightwellii.AAC.1
MELYQAVKLSDGLFLKQGNLVFAGPFSFCDQQLSSAASLVASAWSLITSVILASVSSRAEFCTGCD